MITALGLSKLKEDIQHLKSELSRTVDERSKAAAEGDLRENSAYIFLTERSQVLHTQISELEDQLKHEVLAQAPQKSDLIAFGHRVDVEFISDSRNLSIVLVGKHDSRIKPDWISVESPLGLALLNHKVGDTVVVNDQQVKIHSVSIEEID